MPLCRLLETHGATALRLPAVEIKPHGERRALAAQVGPLQQFDLIVFVSANAVRFGAPLLDQRRDLTLAAVGPATLRALNQAGYRVAILPTDGFDSEGLLAHPRLHHLAGQRVLLVKGLDGRELLQDELEQRGAAVTTVAVYERQRAAPTPAQLAALEGQLRDGVVHVITATSLEIAESLLAMATPELHAQYERVHWLLPSARIAVGMQERGLHAPLLLAASAEDQALVDALLRWRTSTSGA